MFVDCCYCKRASWKIGLESNELPSLNKEFTYLLTYLLTYVLSKNMKIVKKKSTENCHFYSREKSLYIAWACFRNDPKIDDFSEFSR